MPPRESRAKRENLQPEVYRYGITGPLPGAVVAEIRRAHIVRNMETGIYRGTDEAFSVIYAAASSASSALEAAESAKAEVTELREQIRARKAAARSRRPDPDLSAALDAARQRLTEALAAAKDAKAAVRDASRGEVRAVEADAQAQVKALYAPAISGVLFEGDPILGDARGGLYWASFNMVTGKQRTAHAKVIKDRTEGRPAEQKFRFWNGGGTVAVQPQRGSGKVTVKFSLTPGSQDGSLGSLKAPVQTALTAAIAAGGLMVPDSGVHADTSVYHGPLPPPTAPGTTAGSAGGTVPAGVYQVVITYVDSQGETVASEPACRRTAGPGSTLTVKSPAPSGEATGWYAYVSQAGGSTFTRQQPAGAPTSIGTDLVLTQEPASTGAAPPAGTTAGIVVSCAIKVYNTTDTDAEMSFAIRPEDLLQDARYNDDAQVTTSEPGTPPEMPHWQDAVLRWRGTLPAGDPYRTPRVLADPAGKWANVALLVPVASGKRRHGPAAELRFRIGSGASAELVTVPLKMHRPLPEGCDIPQIEITCRRNGHHFTASVAITVLVPAPLPRPADAGTAAVHAGWRAVPGGGLRVAVIAGAEGPPPDITWLTGGSHGGGGRSARRQEVEGRTGKRTPERRKIPVIIAHEGWHEVVLPPEMRDLQAHARSLQSIRDRKMEPVRAAVAAHLAAHPEHKEIIDPKGSAGQWRSPGQFAGVLRRMEESGPDGCGALTAMIAAYLKKDRHLEDWQVAEQARILNWRKDTYRKIAAWVTGTAGRVVADGWEMTRRRPGDGEEETVQEEMARANAVLAAPGELRQLVGVAAGRRGVTVAAAPEGVSGMHHGCAASPAGLLPAEERSAGVAVTCRGCGRQVDQDANALRGMLASAASGGVVT